MADYPLPALPPQFNPSLPFTQVTESATPAASAVPAKPAFNPDQPFEVIPDATTSSGTPRAAFNANQPFTKLFSTEDIATKTPEELAADKEFNPTDFFASNPNIASNPESLRKLLAAYRSRRAEGIQVGETLKAAAKSAIPTVGKFAQGAYQTASNLFVLTGLQDLANTILGSFESPQVKRELQTEGLRQSTEAQAKALAATETSATGIADLARAGARKIFGKSVEEQTDQELLQELSTDAAFQTKLRETTEGRGELLRGVGLDADELAKEGITLDPSAIENMSLVDPLTLVATGGVGKLGFNLIGKGGKVLATVPSVQAGIKLADKLGTAIKPVLESLPSARAVVGKPIEVAGRAVSLAGKTAPTTGAVVGTVKGGPFGTIAGIYAGERLAPKLARAGEAIQNFGQQVSGKAPLSPALASIVEGTRLAAPLFTSPLKGAAIGAGVSLPLAAAAEGSEQAGAILGGGLGLGAVGGGVHGVARVGGELAAKTFFDPHSTKFEPVNSPDYGVDATLDAAHKANLVKRSVNEQGDVTTAREIFRPLGGEIYSVDKTTFANQIIGQLTEQLGRTPTADELAGIQGKIDAQGYFDFERPDGRKVVLLNADSNALWHESGHLTYALLPDQTKNALAESVRANYAPDQLAQLKAQYESRLGSPISEAKFIDELIAENFNAVFNNVPVSQLKAPAGFLRSVGSVLAQVGEVLGADVTQGRTSPDLNVPLTQKLRAQFEGAARELLANAPESQPAAPTPPAAAPAAPTPPSAAPAPPARNIRVTKAQQDALAQRAAETGVTEAKALAAKDADPTVTERVNAISAQMEAGNPVLEIEHLGIADTGTPAAPTGRTPRRGAQAAGYAELERLRVENRANAPADIVNLHQKTFVPVRWTEQGGTPTLIAMSSDKVISNLHQIAKLASEKKAESLLPYEVVNGKLTDAAWRKALADVQAYTENQANGFRGDGQRLTRPTEGELSIPAENKDYVPTQLTPEVANFANLVQGLATPETAREIRGKTPGNVKGQILAELNKRELLTPSVIKPRNVGKQAFKSFPGRSLKEVNPLRNELSARGVSVRELLDVTERIRAKDIASVKPRTDLNFKAPVTDVIRGGFLPNEQSIQQIGDDLRNLDVPGFQAKIKEWGKSLTLKAYEIGENVKSLADIETLRELAREQRATFKEDIAKGDIDAAGASSIKAQFFQEAIEAATGEGGKTGMIRKYVNPDYKPPFPSEGVEFLPRRKAEPVEELPRYLETPEQGRISAMSADFIRTKGTTPQFWLNAETGKVLLAPEGHVEAARDLGGVPSGSDAAQIYDQMESSGWIRGVNDTLNKVYLNGTAELSRIARQTAEDIAFRANKSVTYDGEVIIEKPNIPGQEPEFLPRKPKRDLEKVDFSKYNVEPKKTETKLTGWVLPNKEFVPLSQSYHEQYLAENSTNLNKKFGTKFSDSPDVEERLAALNAGFSRIRYESGTGEAHVEVNAKHWGKQRKAILDQLLDQEDSIDRLSVSLLNDKGQVVDSFRTSLFDVEGAERAGKISEGVESLRGAFLPVAEMTPKEQKAFIKEVQDNAEIKFPEAKIPQFVYNDDGSPKVVYGGQLGRQLEVYNFADTQLAKQASKGKEGKAATEAAATALGDKLAEYYNSIKDIPEISSGVTWYSLARKKLVELFGDDSKLFAELLGATSPQTDVKQNFKYALDAYNQFKAGAFDDILKKYREGKQKWATGDIQEYLDDTGKKLTGPKVKQATRGHFLNWWIEKNELTPYRSEKNPEGKPLRYGMHSKPLLRVLDGSWLEEVVGPKTPNFMGNLTGDTFEATIDIWAARALHRMGAEQPGKRWRILPESETGVTDADFEFGQKAFRHAAEKVGIQPDALQAILWFAEKDHWQKQGWLKGENVAAAEKSDFNTFFAKTEKVGPGKFQLKEEPKIQKKKVAVAPKTGEIAGVKKLTQFLPGEIQPRARVRVERPSRIGPTTRGYWATEFIGGTKPAIFDTRAEAQSFIESEGFTDARIVPADSPGNQRITFKQETSYVPEKGN